MSAEREWELLALPLVVCLLNLGAPYLYRGLAALERHDSPILEVYVAICRCVTRWGRWAFLGQGLCLPGAPPSASTPLVLRRNLILKMVILGILCYHWLGRRVGALKGQVRVGPGGAGGGVWAPQEGLPWSQGQGWRKQPLAAALHASPHLALSGLVEKQIGGPQVGWGEQGGGGSGD